jgi:hypothetical protein
MKNNPDSRPFSVLVLILLQFLLGLGAIGGGGALLLAPDGRILQMPIWILKSSPFLLGLG